MTSSSEKWYKIGDVCNVTDFVANGSFESLRDNVEYLRQKDYAILIRLKDFNNMWKPPYVYVSKESYDFLSKSNLEPGDVIISNVGDPGVVFRAPDLDSKMTLGPNSLVCKIEPRSELLSNDFFYYYLNSHYCQWEIRSRIGGSAQPKFNKTEFRNIKIRLPSKSQQVSSVRLLLNLDKMINNNMKIIEIISRTISCLFRSWFIDFDPIKAKAEGTLPYGMNEEIAALFPDTFEDSEFGPIPVGWALGKLGDIATTKMGQSPSGDSYCPSSEGIPMVNGAADFTDLQIIANQGTKKPTKICEQGDFVYCIRATVGNLRIADQQYCIGRGAAFSREKKASDRWFVYQTIQNLFRIWKWESTGSVMINVTSIQIRDSVLVIPPEPVREKFGRITHHLFEQIENFTNELIVLTNIRNDLLPRLMNGEIKAN